ncbi:unnamed protein product [Urochloa humidicola]
MGGCTNLTTLDLSSNLLQGEIPTGIGALKNLVNLSLHINGLSGDIPHSLTYLPSIKYLSLSNNRLSGDIPPGLGNLSNLWALDLDENMLSGSIPSSLGLLSQLSQLILGYNNLSGLIPPSVWNISSLTRLSVSQNMLTGTIPPNAFNTLPHLQAIGMDNNQFHGNIPTSIGNASDLWLLQLGANLLSGIVPPEIGMLTKLRFLLLRNSLLEAKEPQDWKFVATLANCSQLQIIGLAHCRLAGVLPDSVSNLSTSLTTLSIGHNPISGSLPTDIGNLFNLRSLDFALNSFTGTIPSSLSRLKNLEALSLLNNKLTGLIPLAIGNLTVLNYLYLDGNAFSGRIPNTIGNLTKLLELGLSGNNFTGSIPNELFNIQTLATLFDLSYNNLEGSIPPEIGKLNNLVEFHTESNKLSGQIPSSLGQCQVLQNLYMQNNFLSDSIPSALGQLKVLVILDLANNNLTGQIPKFLGDFTMLHYLNLSFNNFIGEVPTVGIFANASGFSLQGNGKLCGGIPDLHLSPCLFQSLKKKHKPVVIPIVVSLSTTMVILSLLYYILLTWCKRTKTKLDSTTLVQGHPMISYSQLLKATDGFSPTNLLGSGSFGSVYKGELDGQEAESKYLVAVKVLKLQNPRALKSFVAECEALRNMRHRNLVKIITACASIDARGDDFKAIVYDFMPNGSLDVWIHTDADEQAEQRNLDLSERVTILLDVAYALDYLHCDGPTPVIHCDLKSSNVLLDADMVAHVGDFGLAKIIVDGSSIVQQSASSTGFRGTIGYAAPEYGAGNVVSTNGDIYSYGILVLEMVTGKRPTDNTLRGGLSLREHVELALHNGTMDIIDMRLFLSLKNEAQGASEGEDDSSHERKTDGLISLLRLGLACSEESPSRRMPTGDIIKELLSIKVSLL